MDISIENDVNLYHDYQLVLVCHTVKAPGHKYHGRCHALFLFRSTVNTQESGSLWSIHERRTGGEDKQDAGKRINTLSSSSFSIQWRTGISDKFF